MLTGDKLETATCIAKSSHLVGRNQSLHVLKSVLTRYDAASMLSKVKTDKFFFRRTDAHLELNQFRRKQDCALVVSGESLEVCLQYYQDEFMELATASPAVVCCRCSPTQKAQVVSLIQRHTGKRACAVGDGGNDVSMIQQSDAGKLTRGSSMRKFSLQIILFKGVGIEGREGRQASLAGDFSIPAFSYISKLLLVHGRRSYKRSAALSQFVIHRGLIISTMQAVFSAVFYLSSVALYQALLQVTEKCKKFTKKRKSFRSIEFRSAMQLSIRCSRYFHSYWIKILVRTLPSRILNCTKNCRKDGA